MACCGYSSFLYLLRVFIGALICGFIPLVNFIVDILYKGPTRMLFHRSRNVRPEILRNSEFGTHEFYRLPVGYESLVRTSAAVVLRDLSICAICKMRCAISAKLRMHSLQIFNLNLTITLALTIQRNDTQLTANRKPVRPTYKCSREGVQPRIYHYFRDISSQRIFTLTFDPSGSSKFKFDGASRKPLGPFQYHFLWVSPYLLLFGHKLITCVTTHPTIQPLNDIATMHVTIGPVCSTMNCSLEVKSCFICVMLSCCLQNTRLKLHCVVGGQSDKPLMLFLHGFPDFWYSWRHQLKEFCKDYRSWC